MDVFDKIESSVVRANTKMKTIVIDNFFSNYDEIIKNIHKLKFYERKNHPEFRERENSWPGFRTEWLRKVDESLYWLIVKEIQENFDNQLHMPTRFGHVLRNRNYLINCYFSLKTETTESKDNIHQDGGDYSLLVYCGPTNTNSGTALYDEQNNVLTDVKFVQNRGVMFDSMYRHKGYGAFGDDLKNGRLTLNAMIEWDNPVGAI